MKSSVRLAVGTGPRPGLGNACLVRYGSLSWPLAAHRCAPWTTGASKLMWRGQLMPRPPRDAMCEQRILVSMTGS